jgi:membrane protein YdbS with pleckstrin-like domain
MEDNAAGAIIFHPHTRYRTKLYFSALSNSAVLWTIIVFVLLGYDSNALGGVVNVVTVFAVLLVLMPAPFLSLYYKSIRYEIHTDEIIVSMGIITKTVKHVPFRTVTNLTVTRGPIDRLFGIGSLSIQTAGSGSVIPEEKLVGLSDTQEVYEYVANELRHFRNAIPPTQAGEEKRTPPSTASERQLLVAILRELQMIRLGKD